MEVVLSRKLAAILAADVAGYSRLVEADEEGTLATLRGHRAAMDRLLEAEGGRIVSTAGDSVLAEFASPVSAVRAALSVQAALRERNAALAPEKRVIFRIGINLGDVVVQGEDLLGEGVNVAARLQEIAPAGGLFISAKVHDEVQGKVDAGFLDRGERQLKNIIRPVRIFEAMAGTGAEAEAEVQPPPADQRSAPRSGPSLAVLPFINLSGDPEKEYFSDGITEDLITNLARSRWFTVAARNSTFVYKSKAVDVSAVGRALHVRYVLEGSVRKSGNRVRVTAQLIETESGSHIWAERYDREITDIFDLQDEITRAVVQAIEPAVWNVESRRAVRKDPQRLDAWDCVLRAFWHAVRMTRDDNVEAIRFARRAVELDSTYARAWSNLAFNLAVSWFWGWAADPEAAMMESLEAAQRALRLDSEDAETLGTLALIHAWRGAVEKAIHYGREGLRLDAGELFAIVGLGLGLIYAGKPDEAIAICETGLDALSEQGKTRERWPVLGLIGLAHLVARRYEKAVETGREAIWANSDYPENYRILAAAYGQLGAIEQGRAAEAEFRRRTLHGAGEMHVSQEPAIVAVMAPMIEGIAKLGLE